MHEAVEAITNPRRRNILRLVWDAERSAGELAAASDVSWPAVSQNLKVLREAGLVKQRKEGRRRLYIADHDECGPLAGVLRKMWAEDLQVMKRLAETEYRQQKGRGVRGE